MLEKSGMPYLYTSGCSDWCWQDMVGHTIHHLKYRIHHFEYKIHHFKYKPQSAPLTSVDDQVGTKPVDLMQEQYCWDEQGECASELR